MKILIFGDIHGRTMWKDIVTKEHDIDYIVFIGDYFDPYTKKTPVKMLENFKEILEIKKENPDKIKLLIGNHDLHYIADVYPCSRYSSNMYELSNDLLKQLVTENILQLCFNAPDTNLWFSHAGFTKTWLDDNDLLLDESKLNQHFKNFGTQSTRNPYTFLETYQSDPYGDDIFQGPMWVRPHSLLLDCPKEDNIVQIVGHTQVKEKRDYDRQVVLFCDSLNWNLYYIYDTRSLCFTQKSIKR
jgi:hypothetical protein